MLDTELEFDRKLRALFDHIKTQDPSPRLALIRAPATRSDRKVLGRLAGVAGIAVIAAGIVLFATELNAHRVITPPKHTAHTVAPPPPVWSPSPLPSPNPRLALPSLPNRTLLPASVRVLVPETQGIGDASVTIVPDAELYIQYACVGDGSVIVTPTGGSGPDLRPACSSSAAGATVIGTSSSAYPNQVLKTSELGKPVTINISSSPLTTWEIFIAESAHPIATEGWIAVSANPTAMIGEHNDIYFLSTGVPPRRVIGSDGDGVTHDCPAFSPDGQRLAYGQARASGATNNARGAWPVSDRAVVVVGVDAYGVPTQPLLRVALPTSPGEIACPTWSPDGRYVAYRVGADLWVADTSTGTTTLFPVEAMQWGENGIAWSRDGSCIAVAEPAQIRIVPIDGSTPTVIPVFGQDPGSFSGSIGWTAGDSSIVYVSTNPNGVDLDVNRVDTNGTNDIHIAAIAAGSEAAVSPDGTRVAYIEIPSSDQPLDETVMTMPARGGKGVAVAVPPNAGLEGVSWSPDDQRLLLDSISGVFSVAVAPGQAPVVYMQGSPPFGTGLDLEWTWPDVTWQPVASPSR